MGNDVQCVVVVRDDVIPLLDLTEVEDVQVNHILELICDRTLRFKRALDRLVLDPVRAVYPAVRALVDKHGHCIPWPRQGQQVLETDVLLARECLRTDDHLRLRVNSDPLDQIAVCMLGG